MTAPSDPVKGEDGGDQDSAPEPDPSNPAGFRDDTPATSGNQPPTDPAALNKFLDRAYFTRLHKFADKPEDHPLRGKVCFLADFVVRTLAALLILAIAAIAAWKSLSPLPWDH